MKRVVLGVLVAVFMSLAFAPDADARLFRRQSRGGSSSSTGSYMTYTPTRFSTEKRLFDGKYSLQDIATILEIPLNTVKTLTRRARLSLAKALAEHVSGAAGGAS